MNTCFKSEKGKQEIFDLYDQKLESLEIEYTYRQLETSFGSTNIIVTGDPTNPPIVLVHGSNGCAPIALETYPDLHKTHRVFAVDVLAQPNKSAGVRLSMRDESYGRWMNEILSALDLDSVILAGFSFGGLVILKTLEEDSSRISEVFLTAPAYIVNGNPLRALFRMFIPMKRYMKTRDKKYVERFLSELFTEEDDFAMEYLSKVFLEFDMDFTPVPVIRSEKAGEISTPINIIAAGNDLLFPGKKMLKRAKKIFPSLKEGILLHDSKHVQNKTQNRMIAELIANRD